jgi:hypothetical protein
MKRGCYHTDMKKRNTILAIENDWKWKHSAWGGVVWKMDMKMRNIRIQSGNIRAYEPEQCLFCNPFSLFSYLNVLNIVLVFCWLSRVNTTVRRSPLQEKSRINENHSKMLRHHENEKHMKRKNQASNKYNHKADCSIWMQQISTLKN